MAVLTNTKALFVSLIKEEKCDLIVDIGSRDGVQSILFRNTVPEAKVIAFEANPINFEKMRNNSILIENQIEMFPYAVSNITGESDFFVTNVDYDNPNSNTGTSSLLICPDLAFKKPVRVKTVRIDEFLSGDNYKGFQSIALWIDVEGAEYYVLECIKSIKEKVKLVHVETSIIPIRENQMVLSDLESMLESLSLFRIGSNIDPDIKWGDVVFINRELRDKLGFKLKLSQLRAYLSSLARVDNMAVFLKSRYPEIYAFLRKVFIKYI